MSAIVQEDACRVCLKQKSKDLKISIFEKLESDNMTVADKIMMCGDVQISQDQKLPNKICKKCLNSLEVAYNFRKLCKKTDNILQILLNKNNRNNIIVSLENGKTYKLPQDIKIKVIKTEKNTKIGDNEINTKTSQNKLQNNISEGNEKNCDTFKNEDIQFESLEEDILINHIDITCLQDLEDYDEYKNYVEIEKIPNHNSKNQILQKSIKGKQIIQKTSKKSNQKISNNKVQDELNELITEAINSCNDDDDTGVAKTSEKSTIEDKDSDDTMHDEENSGETYDDDHNNEYVSTIRLRIKKESEKSKYICEQCGNTYKQRCQLTLHMKRHRNEKNYPCEICGQLFLTNSLMARHLKRHTGVRPYKCSYCTRRFYENGSCRAHEKTHSGVRPYVCQICDKSFIYSQGLTKHMLIHNEIKLYSCSLCNKEFRLKHHLTQHFQTLMHQEAVQKFESSKSTTIKDG